MDYSEDPEPHNPQADDWRELAERYKRDRDEARAEAAATLQACVGVVDSFATEMAERDEDACEQFNAFTILSSACWRLQNRGPAAGRDLAERVRLLEARQEMAAGYERDRDKIVEILDDAGLPRAHDKGQHTLPARVKMLAEDQAFDAKYREKYRGELETVKAALARAVDLIGRVEMSPLLQEEADAIATDPMSASALMEWRTLSVERDEVRAKLAKAEEENARLRMENGNMVNRVGDANRAEDSARALAAERLAALGRAVAALQGARPRYGLDSDVADVWRKERDAILDDPTCAAAVEAYRVMERLCEVALSLRPWFTRGGELEDAADAYNASKVAARRSR